MKKTSLTENQTTSTKKQQNKCVKLRKRSIKTYIENITKSGVMSNKTFWRTVRPFLTNNY